MIYLDNAATTLPLDTALEKYMEVSKNAFGNSSSLHTAGLGAASVLETARESVASLLGCERESRLIGEIGSVSGMLIAAVSMCSVMFILAFNIFIRI